MIIPLPTVGGHHVVAWLIMAAIAGYLGAAIVVRRRLGILTDIGVGLVGASIGGVVLQPFIGHRAVASPVLESVVAFGGATVMLGLLNVFSNGKGERHRRHTF